MRKVIKLRARKCAVCGSEFLIMNFEEYAWRFQGKLCCSYTCFRKLEKPLIEKYTKRLFKNVDID